MPVEVFLFGLEKMVGIRLLLLLRRRLFSLSWLHIFSLDFQGLHLLVQLRLLLSLQLLLLLLLLVLTLGHA